MSGNLTTMAKATRARMPSLFRYGYLGFRLLRRHCSRWYGLISSLFGMLLASAEERTDFQIRYFKSLARIDFPSVYGLVNDWLF
jgi:hypothetical protein